MTEEELARFAWRLPLIMFVWGWINLYLPLLTLLLLLSPMLPLPVEFVAGGDGSPEWVEEELGLGGSGKSGILGEEELLEPRKIADKGRLFEKEGREVIGQGSPCSRSSI
jgi:hypothetical protein